MENKIKIAVPTDDGILVRQQFKGSRGFVIVTVRDGIILRQELRWNLLSEMLTSEHGSFYNLVDCNVLIVDEIGPRQQELLEDLKKKIIHTSQAVIPEAINDYLSRTHFSPGVKNVA
jgi:predicted Fe-Mo cluster-binding NifX family protein